MFTREFKARLTERRESKALSKAELARLLGVSRQNVQAWEEGKGKPLDEQIMLGLARELGTSVSYLYGETDDPRPAPNWHTSPSSELESRVAAAREKLAEADAILNLDGAFADRQELRRIVGMSAYGSTLHPEKAVKSSKSKAQGA